jgi:acyl-ACP dehydrogenase
VTAAVEAIPPTDELLGSLAELAREAEEARRPPRRAFELFAASGIPQRRWEAPDGLVRAVDLAHALGDAGIGGLGVGLSVHFESVLSMLVRFDAPARVELVRRCFAGQSIGCIGASEAHSGSNLLAVRCTTERHGDRLRVSGEKAYVSLAPIADFALVLVRGPGSGLSVVLVPRSGFDPDPDPVPASGVQALGTSRVEIDADLDSGNLVGPPGHGLFVLSWGLAHERLAGAAQALGTARRALRLAVAHARRREQFGRRLLEHQALRLRLAELWAELEQAELALRARVADMPSSMTGFGRSTAAAKVTAAKLAVRVVDEAQHVLGAAGYLETSSLPQLARDVRFARLGGGVDEVLLELVAGGLPSDEDAPSLAGL